MKSVTSSESATAFSDPPAVSRHQLPTSDWSLVDWYLEQQGQLTAVEQFARVQTELTVPVYRALLPTKAPGPGEQYAFEVDLDRCSGCKACVTACHSLNGLDDAETWRDVGLLTGGHDQRPFQQHVTTACHHCIEPACMDVCPTLAYEKDARTGIVKHLDDQCFGCQYCILACPYNVPRYNARLGIVRKCDMCAQRLKVGEAPACVQACPHEAIRIQIVNLEQVKSDAESSQFLPGTPDPQYTLPTTNYKTERPLPRNLMPADYFRVHTEHAHGPLVTMLVLTQMSVGGYLALLLSRWVEPIKITSQEFSVTQTVMSLLIGYVALFASLLHLGRPWLAYRAILGLKTSWLSREILAFGLFAGCATGLTVRVSLPQLPCVNLLSSTDWLTLTVGSGLLGVFCSAMIYHRTKRPFWNLYQSGTRFLLTTALLGLAVTWISFSLSSDSSSSIHGDESSGSTLGNLLMGLIVLTLLKGLFELGALVPLMDRPQTALKRSALLLTGPLQNSLAMRYGLLLIFGMVLECFAMKLLLSDAGLSTNLNLMLAIVCGVGLTWGELIERSLFFKASVAFRMPGGPSA